MAQAMRDFVTGLDQKRQGVDVHLGKGVERDKIELLAVKCGPGGTGCNSDCCDPEFAAKIEGIDVSGLGDNVTMHLRGAITVGAVSEKMARCDCYNEL
jgi:hypothetical protein